MKRFTRPGVLLGIVAVVLAMTGSAFAASKITGAQIKDGTLTGRDLKNRSIGSSKLDGTALAELEGPQGASGPAGPTGPSGPAGPAGPSAVGGLTPVTSAQVSFAGQYATTVTAYCPAGQRVVSGGGASISLSGIAASQANVTRTGWFVVGGTNDPSVANQYVQAYAQCAPANVAVAASATGKTKDKAEIDRIVERYTQLLQG